jgi:hypothetical protein
MGEERIVKRHGAIEQFPRHVDVAMPWRIGCGGERIEAELTDQRECGCDIRLR